MDALCHSCVQLTGVELDRSRPGCQLSYRLFFGLGLSLNLPHQLNRINHLSISSQTGMQPCMWKQQPVPGDRVSACSRI